MQLYNTYFTHAGGIHLQSIPGSRSYLDDPPSISEGWGGRVTDYRITVCMSYAFVHNMIHLFTGNMSVCTHKDFNQLIQDNMLYPNPIDRTQIPTTYPLHRGKDSTLIVHYVANASTFLTACSLHVHVRK